MNKELEKLLFNPVRLKILSFLFSIENASFKKLMEVSEATKGNISVQIKKLEDEHGVIPGKQIPEIPTEQVNITDVSDPEEDKDKLN